MIPILIIVILLFSLLLIKSADLVVVALRRISRQTKTGVFALSAFILAIGTSLPELFVAITSSLENTPSLSLGNVLGANIANISLVVGFSSLIAGKVIVHGSFLKRDVYIALFAGLLPILLIIDGTLSRVDGLILLASYGAYATSLFRTRFLEIAEEHKKERFFYRFMRQFNHMDSARTKELGRLFVGIALLLISADVIVRVARQLAQEANIPFFLVGLIVLSIGTTLPEIAFSFRSLKDHEPTMFFGNILGSIIAHSTLVIGVAALITPIKVVAVEAYIEAAIAFILVFFVFWNLIRSKFRLDRWESFILLVLYIIFIVVEFS